MKRFLKSLLVVCTLAAIISSCSSTKSPYGAQHNRGVNNRHFQGY